MGETTTIGWTQATFNPWWGCTKVSPACDSCYAERDAHRYGHDVWGKNAERRFLSDHHWAEPLKWDRAAAAAGKPTLVFCASMCDVFEHRVPDDLEPHRARLWELIESTPHLIWQLLTKRPEWVLPMTPLNWKREWPENVWVGTTVEAEKYARIRLPRLCRIPAPVLFLSMEPLLGDVDLSPWIEDIDWVIVGGESGPDRRPFDLDTARRIRDACVAAPVPVPFFFKQAGGYRSGTPGPPDLECCKQFPDAARRGA